MEFNINDVPFERAHEYFAAHDIVLDKFDYCNLSMFMTDTVPQTGAMLRIISENNTLPIEHREFVQNMAKL